MCGSLGHARLRFPHLTQTKQALSSSVPVLTGIHSAEHAVDFIEEIHDVRLIGLGAGQLEGDS